MVSMVILMSCVSGKSANFVLDQKIVEMCVYSYMWVQISTLLDSLPPSPPLPSLPSPLPPLPSLPPPQLHRNDHDVEKALQELVKRPIVSRLVSKKNWNKESTVQTEPVSK